MVQTHSCQRCGSATDARSLDGLCGRCLAAVGFSTEAEDPDERTAAERVAVLDKTIILDSGAMLQEAASSGRFGDYELIEEIARGGMGVVYKARQVSLNRVVAVKMILNARFNNPEYVRRFRAEAEAAANLHHPNIVAIYEIGEEEGQHYFSMEYVEGRDLASLVREQPLPPQRAAEHVGTIAQAMQYAHHHGILHRDLKPSNVLVDLEGELRITDFGLAKRVSGFEGSGVSTLGQSAGSLSDVELTVSGQVLGSPSYMSPEQAAGKSRDVDVRSDVYALGAILYTLITGRPPFMADAIETTLLQVLQTEPASPRLINPRVPKDLETICLKCLQKEPQRRYASAQEVADELGRFLRCEPIRARPLGGPAKAWRWCRRNPRLAAVTALAVSALLVISIGSPIAAYRLNAARLVAEERELKARRNAYAADMAVVQQAIEQRNYGHALRLLSSHRPAANQPDVRGWEFRYFWERCRSDELDTIANCGTDILDVRVSPGGKWAAGLDRSDQAYVWNIAEKKELLRIDAGEAGRQLIAAFSPDDTTFALATSRTVKFWSMATFQQEPGALEHSSRVNLMQFLPNGTLATISGTNLLFWDARTRSRIESRSIPRGTNYVLSADGSVLALTRQGQGVVVWKKGAGFVRSWQSAHAPASSQMALALSPDASLVVAGVAMSAGSDFAIQVWNVATGNLITNLAAHVSYITSLAFSPGGDLLVSTSFDQTMELWDTRLWRRIAILKGHTHPVNSTGFLPDNERLISGGSDGALKLWNARPERSSATTLALPPDLINELINERLGALSVNASAAVMLKPNGEGVLVDTRRPAVVAEIRLPFVDARKVAVHREPASATLAIARANGVISLWDGLEQRLLGEFVTRDRRTTYVLKFSPNGLRLAARSGDHTQVWDTNSRRELPAWSNRLLAAADLQFSPDGQMLACGEESGTISFWEVETGSRLFSLTGPSRRFNRIAFSADGSRLGATSWDGTARAWDIRSRKEIARVHGSKTSFYRVSFSPNGSRLCVSEYDNAVLFEIQANRQVARLKTFTPFFIDDDAVLGLSSTELWHWRPPSIAAIDSMDARVPAR